MEARVHPPDSTAGSGQAHLRTSTKESDGTITAETWHLMDRNQY